MTEQRTDYPPVWARHCAERCGEHSDFGMECDLIEGHAGTHMALHTNGLVRGAWPAKPKTFSEQFHGLLREAAVEYDLTPDPGLSEPIERPLTVRYASGYQNISCCLLTDATGVNHCDHPASPRPSLAKRTRWRIRSWWSGLRLRAGSWIAGVDLDREDD